MQKNINTFNNKWFIGYFLLIMVTIIVTFFVFLFIVEKRIINVKFEELKIQEENIINLEKGLLGKEFDGILSDLLYLSENLSSTSIESELEHISSEWRLFSEKKKIYDQIRYLDSTGNEVIRINYTNEAVIVDDELQNKSDRYYFQETVKLRNDQVYISKLDLNIENNEVELPLKPVVRFSKPIYKEDQLLGIIVLNYRAEFLFSEFKEISKESAGDIFLLNSNGDWLSSSGDTLICGFTDKTTVTKFQNIFVDEWEDIKNTEGSLLSENGLFTYGNVIVSDNLRVNGDLLSDKIVLGDGFWKVVSFIDVNGKMKNVINTSNLNIALRILKTNLTNLISVTVLSSVVSLLFISNKRSNLQIKYFSEYDSLTNVLNRRAGVIALMNSLPHNNNKVDKVNLCYLDINGLKEVNDCLGHDTGDELIRTVSKVFKESIGLQDFVIRLGGDEFLIVLVNKDIYESELMWSKIKQRFDYINQTEKRKYLVSVSHGIAEYKTTYKDFIDKFINSADEKMYIEKKEIKKNIKIIKNDNGN